MPDNNRTKIDIGIVAWLIALSFWSGTVYLQVLNNTKQIDSDKLLQYKIWDRLTNIDNRLSVIQGKLGMEGRE